MKRSFVFGLCLFLVSHLFAQINIVSPIKGTWSNKQMLVLDTTSDGDYFYSVDGSDPASFGFAYDGPVLLDVEGEVTLKIAKVISRTKKEYVEVKYKVNCDDSATASYGSFISTFYDTGVINYTAGTELSIPESLYFSFGLPPDAFVKGQTVSISDKTILNRNIPCTLWDQTTNKKYRFIICTFPVSAGAFSRRDLPIKITDWEKIEFLDKNLIYKIDGDYWGLPKEAVNLDRTVSHMISYQNIAYEFGNPIEFIILPAKPEISTFETDDGELKISINGDPSYRLAVLDADNSYQELFEELVVDVFYGDKVNGVLKAGIFCNGLLQGTVEIPYELNKRPPAAPFITSNTDNFYTRSNVEITITGSKEGQLYYAVSEPFPVNGNRYTPESPIFKDCYAGNFLAAEGSEIKLQFTGLKESGVYYKVCAYSMNGSNPSEITEYSVIIDQYNYFFDSTANEAAADGTAERPFTDFTKMLEYLNLSRSVSLSVTGDMIIPKGKHMLTSNCVINGNKNSSITFEADAQLVAIDSSLDIKNITVKNKKDGSSTKIIPMIKGERSNLIFTDCLLYGDFEKNGTILEAMNSNVYVDKSICAVACSSYASFISSVKSKISIKNTKLNTSADTCVVISMSEGQIDCKDNTFKISGKTGRIAELFGVTGSFNHNVFKAELSKVSKSIVPVFTENKSNVALVDNENYGF